MLHQNLAIQTIIVSVSGSIEKKYQNMANQSGMNYYLFKPVDQEELEQLVCTLKFPKRTGEADMLQRLSAQPILKEENQIKVK